jgi:hypothetical protein
MNYTISGEPPMGTAVDFGDGWKLIEVTDSDLFSFEFELHRPDGDYAIIRIDRLIPPEIIADDLKAMVRQERALSSTY